MSSQSIDRGLDPIRGAADRWRLGAWIVALLAPFASLWGAPTSALERIDGIVLPADEEDLGSAVIDSAGEFAYFGTDASPGQVVKIDLATFARVDALTPAEGQVSLASAVIDPAGAFAYFGAFEFIVGLGDSSEGRVIKVDLETFTPVDTLTLTSDDVAMESAVIDPAGQFAYFGTDTFPGRVIKIDLADFTFVDSIVLSDGEDQLVSAVIDPAGEFAYFGTDTIPGQVIKIDLATLARVDALTLPDDEGNLASAVIDPAGEFAYFGGSSFPGRVIKIDLATFTRADALTLAAGEDLLDSAVIDPGGELAYFGADENNKGCGSGPGGVVEIDLETFTRVDALTLAEGEECLEAAVIDPGGEFAYFGTGTSPGRIVKIAVGAPGPELAYDPSSLDFGEVEVGTTSPPQNATLMNTGDAEATGLEFGLTGDSGFTVDAGACGDTLPAGGACEIVVTFGPDLVGELFAALDVSSAEDAAASLSLSGTGLGEILAPVGLTVDATPLLSDGNHVFEPGECVEVAPAWLWLGAFDLIFGGEASTFEGPEGPSYDLIIDEVFYGEVESAEIADCRDTDTCYAVQVGPSGVARPATHWDASLDEELFTKGDLPSWTWILHIGESFADVPRTSSFYRSVEALLHHGVTGGCATAAYCPAGTTSRAQMAVFVLKALGGPGYVPQACVEDEEEFGDLPAASPFCPWVEELARRGVVAGCGGGDYCPGSPVTRAQMAVVLLKTLAGSDYTPLPCQGLFTDVTCPSPFANWIEDLFLRDITGGCDDEPLAYCPGSPVSRAQMAVFVTRTFGLEIYGP